MEQPVRGHYRAGHTEIAVRRDRGAPLVHGMRDVTPVVDEGAFSIIVDPTGAALGLWQQTKK